MQKRKPFSPYLLAFTTGTILSVIACVVVRRAEFRAAEARFMRTADNRISAIRWELEGNITQLRAVAAFFGVFGHQALRADEFRDFVFPILARDPSLRAIAWVLPDSVEGEARREPGDWWEPVAETQTTGGKEGVPPASGDNEFRLVHYVAPSGDDAAVYSLDGSILAGHREALQRAIDTGAVVADPYTKPGSTEDVPSGFLLSVPVYRRGARTSTEAVRRATLQGLVVALLDVGRDVESAMSYLRPGGIDVQVSYAADEIDRSIVFHASRLRGGGEGAASIERGRSVWLRTAYLDFAGSRWRIDCAPAPGFHLSDGVSIAWYVAIGGILFSVLVTIALRINVNRASDLTSANTRLEQEIAERRAVEARLRHESRHDTLTDLPNRTALLERLERCVERAERFHDSLFAVLFLDIDNFKLINDSLGHAAGDRLLVETSYRLETCLRTLDTVAYAKEDTTARFGGDEFVILLDRIRTRSDALFVAERLHEHLTRPFDLDGHHVVITASIGVAVGDGRYKCADDVLRDADTAMYRAKLSGKAQHAIFDETMHTEALQRLNTEHDLTRAVEEKQFALLYQPIVALDTGCVVGYEALLRWNHPKRGVLAPAKFIVYAEEMGLTVPIGRWVLNEACRALKDLTRRVGPEQRLSVNVNISRRQLEDADFTDIVERAVREYEVSPGLLHLEIAEHALVGVTDRLITALHRLKELGVCLHMDNFGTGYSSITCLNRLPLDVIDIDGLLISTIGANRQYAVITRAVVDLAHNLNMKVLAEGIEKEDQLASVLSVDCDFAQGDHFHKPMNESEIAQLALSEAPWLKPA